MKRIAAAALTLLLGHGSALALTIEFDYSFDTRGFFTDPVTGAAITERRAILDLAASFYSGFADALAAIEPQAGDSWSVSFTHPSLGGPALTVVDQVIAADTVRIYVGGSASAPGVLGFANTGYNLQASGSASFVDAVLARGQENALGAGASDYATWGGMIWFNAANDWYFGASESGLGSSQSDFLSTAIHEIGHILGFGTAASWTALLDGGYFHGAASMAEYGGPVPVDRYGVHWAEGVMSLVDGRAQETLMDPSTPAGQRQLPTALDYAGFVDIGWQVSPVPEPQTYAMLLAGVALLAARHRRRAADLCGPLQTGAA